MKTITVLNGPNLNLLGTREPEVYGSTSLQELEDRCRAWGTELGYEAYCRQSNHEGELIDLLHAAGRAGVTGVVLNAGGYTHTSVALRDAIAGIRPRVVEVHISNVHARDSFRRHSQIAAVCAGSISGLGLLGYKLAMLALVEGE